MNKFKTWWYVFQQSLTNTSYYKDVLKVDSLFSLKYLYILLAITTFLLSLKYIVPVMAFIPHAPAKLQEFKAQAVNMFPPELEVRIQNGEVSTNVPEPYVIALPQKVEKEEGSSTPKNLVVIDTKAKVEDFEDYNTFVLVTKSALVYPDRSNYNASTGRTSYGYKVYPLKNIKDAVVINKTTYMELFNKLNPYIEKVPMFLTILVILGIFIFPFMFAAFSLLGKLIYLAMVTLLVVLIAKLMSRKIAYGTLYKLGVHGLTLPIVVTTLLSLFAVHIPLLYTLLFIGWMAYVVNVLPKKV